MARSELSDVRQRQAHLDAIATVVTLAADDEIAAGDAERAVELVHNNLSAGRRGEM